MAEVMTETARAADAQQKGLWVTYLIRDPRRRDRRGNPGLPMYVGQTNDFPGRVLTRFMTCEKEAIRKGRDCVEARVAELLHLGIVARYEVLDYQPTRLSSLVAETNWARRCRNAGYDIANRAELQKEGGPMVGRGDIPKTWLHAFSLAEAIEDHVQVIVSCDHCGYDLALPLPSVQALDNRPRTLGALRDCLRGTPCVRCNTEGKRRVRLGVS